jgi:hypothetical protein
VHLVDPPLHSGDLLGFVNASASGMAAMWTTARPRR